MQLFTALRGDVLGQGFRGRILTSPVAWECKAHDGFLDSDVTLQWFRRSPHELVVEEAHQGQQAQGQAAVTVLGRPPD